jgi:hypothetical protein
MSRRTATTAGRQQQQQRTPQPSIKSSQVFAPQPTREQTQYQQMNSKKQLQQQQLQQQMRNNQQDYHEEYSEKENVGVMTKMTVAQAITLITLRLGSLETKLMNGEFGSTANNIDEETLINVSNRLDSLETKTNLSFSSDYKQQIEHLTQAVIQYKNMSNSFVKENKELKTQLVNLKKEMSDVRELIEIVKNMAVSNENKIFQMLNMSSEFQIDDQIEIKMDNETDFNLSDSEHSILETDIRQTLETNNENNEELQITHIENL